MLSCLTLATVMSIFKHISITGHVLKTVVTFVLVVDLALQVNNMALDENAGGDRLRFVLTDKTPSSDLQLVCQAPSEEVRQNWITQISSILDMQGDLLRGNSVKCVISFSLL